MVLKKNVIGFLAAISTAGSLFAQAYHAGDITYEWLYGYTYSIRYTTYTTNNGGIDNRCELDSACMGDGTSVKLYRTNGAQIFCAPPAKDGVALNAQLKLNEYVVNHTFPGPGNYTFCFDQLGRVAGTVNIPNAVNSPFSLLGGLAISTFFSPNNSPSFGNLAVVYGCLNGSFTYNPLATDPDGDSLSYSLLSCGLIPGYSFPGNSTDFFIDPVSGQLTWNNLPASAGNWNVVIRIDEWRKDSDGNYQKVGFVYRETEINLSSCTSINEYEKENSVSVYPDPATNQATLHFAGDQLPTTVQLVDITGHLLETLNSDVITDKTCRLNLEQLSPGLYFVKLNYPYQTIIKKIIKQ